MSKTDAEVKQDKSNRIMEIVNERAGYYRRNPQRFVEEYLGITTLKWFQKILLWIMMIYDNFLFIAARGIGFKILFF